MRALAYWTVVNNNRAVTEVCWSHAKRPPLWGDSLDIL